MPETKITFIGLKPEVKNPDMLLPFNVILEAEVMFEVMLNKHTDI